MRLPILIALTMVAFAANSVLNRAALAAGGIDAVSFGSIRLWSGAVVLVLLGLLLRGRVVLGGPGRVAGVLGLVLYIYGFSVAYVALDAGLGALILFGTVQVTMFGGSLIGGERPPLLRWMGAAMAFGGLIWLLWPGGGLELSLVHGAAMVLAGVGWGIYSLAGRRADDPLLATGANFVLAAPIGFLLGLALPVSPEAVAPEVSGIVLAVISGAVTSGLGYALWYHVLPQVTGSIAAVAQLTVPVIAMAGGMIFLGEAVTADFMVASMVVLGGVALSVLRR
ncbi:DMT family transporter [Antarctobacter heliothermus]|uniref:EamA-like transporter family protein n=1 Tax=Antarctobacter heliothermus TaxID=74033 RepID=A0A239CBX9_9RHOB|nr:DMT family transporter [Antarctobacter heliothermus]SNS17725.1 EamA-like transporter family protein [Antarctobacter heliothermus]